MKTTEWMGRALAVVKKYPWALLVLLVGVALLLLPSRGGSGQEQPDRTEQAASDLDASYRQELEQRLRKNKFTLQDFYDQLVQLKSMGSITDILGMMPGMNAGALKNVQVDEKALSRTEAIILSMTPYERENPGVINHSRKQRIAAGAGVQVQQINALLKQFDDMQKLMRQFTGPGASKKMKRLQKSGMGGMGNMGGKRGFGGFGRR